MASVGRSAAGIVAAIAGAAGFVVLSTANAGGYRYAASDQAFYLPAVRRALDPGFFPRDAALIDTQARLMITDEVVAGILSRGSVAIQDAALTAHIVTLLVLFVAAVAFARSFLTSPWAIAAFCAAMTLRHRIAETGANTLESYFHPRVLAFALGTLAVAACLRQGRWTPTLRALVSLALAGSAFIVHPTTGLWFGIWTMVALGSGYPSLRRPLGALAVAIVAIGAWAVTAGPMAGRLVAMDPQWTAAFADKDYVFPTAWGVLPWLVHLGLTALIVWTWRVRIARGIASRAESGVVIGCLTLVVLFLTSLPFIVARVAMAVQLQTSRVFWMVDLVALVYLVWWLAEADWHRATKSRPFVRGAIVLGLVLAFSVGRSVYVLFVEHPERRLFQRDIANADWADVGRWLREHTPRQAHLLADPGHAWKYGASLRATAERDVLIEGVKDAAVAMYSRDVALRVVDRLRATENFDTLDADELRALGKRYDLDLVVADHDLALPEAYRNRTFRVYRLR
jgi:hypothetical protein